MFTVKLELKGQGTRSWDYDYPGACIADSPIRWLFEEGLVESCVLIKDGKRVVGLPLMTWECYRERVRANSVALLEP